jgi:hypothetical protein
MVGCPVESVVQPVKFGESSHGIPLYFDQVAANADHVIVVNRIKPHTRLTGSIQSGLCKMLMIGLGKHRGAQAYHPVFKSFDYRLDRVTDEIVPLILSRMPVLAGVAIIENALDSVGRLEVLPAGEILAREPRLLATAQDWMPRLPFDHAELLIVDAIGKEISGTGMDTNIIGRKRYDKHAAAEEWPKVDEIYVRRLTEKTAGNASGIGIAEYTHRRVAEAIDWPKTRVNCITAGHPTGAALPVWFDSDQAVLRAVCEQAPLPAAERRWMHIVNTLDLTRVRCSEAYYREAVLRAELEVIDAPAPLNFDAAADLA